MLACQNKYCHARHHWPAIPDRRPIYSRSTCVLHSKVQDEMLCVFLLEMVSLGLSSQLISMIRCLAERMPPLTDLSLVLSTCAVEATSTPTSPAPTISPHDQNNFVVASHPRLLSSNFSWVTSMTDSLSLCGLGWHMLVADLENHKLRPRKLMFE